MRIILICLLVLPAFLQAQVLQGRVSSSDGKPIAFASIYVPELHKGTTANSDGDFVLPLPEGTHQIVVQYLGYAGYRITLKIGPNESKRLDVVLQPQAMALPEVIVTASGEDPAAFIMRKAIALSPYYRNQLEEYQARVYVKGTGLPEKIPALLRPQLRRDGIREGRYIVSETLSEIHYRRGQPLQTRVISTRSAGLGNEDVPMQFATLSLYNDINGVISPLSRDAFAVYRFRLEGTYLEEGRTISRIRVIPRRKGQDVYSGTIMIREGSWNLHSVDLSLKTNLFDLSIRQVYHEVEPLVWMPVSHNYDLRVEAFGGRGTFKYVATLSDIRVKLNPQIDHQKYAAMMEVGAHELGSLVQKVESSGSLSSGRTPAPANPRLEQLAAKENLNRREMREMNRLITMDAGSKRPATLEIRPANIELDDSARLRTPEYWNQNRPVPLTAGEAASFNETADSTQKSDSLKRSNRISALLFGKNDYKLTRNVTFSHNGFADFSAWGYNTVDGLKFSQRTGMVIILPNARRIKPFLDLSCNFARKSFNYSAEAEFLTGPMTRTRWTVSAGRLTSDYNTSTGIPPFVNAISTLFFSQNHMKLYEKDFVTMSFATDIINGLSTGISFEFASRRPLENTSNFAFFRPAGREFTPNIPPPFASRPELFEPMRAALLGLSLSWTHEYFYRVRDGRKVMAYSRYPTLSLQYRTAIPGPANATARYSHWEAGLRHSFTRRLIGTINYGFAAGFFTDTTRMGFQDYRHFRTDPLPIGETWSGAGFRSANFYSLSTNKPYALMHARLSSGNLLLKRIPALSLRNFDEQVRFATRFAQGHAPMFELGYGLQRLFLFADAELFVAFGPALYQKAGFNISLPVSRLVP